jgi:cell division protein FtsL
VSSQAATRATQRAVRAPAQQQFRLRLARRVQPTSRLAFAVLTALVVVTGVLALAALTVAVNQQAFAVAKLEQANKQSATRYSVLQAEVDALKSPARVSRVAHERGLRPISRARIVRWPSAPQSGGNASLASTAATSPAAVGATSAAGGDNGLDDPVKAAGQVWTQDDPFPLKHYLAQP